ncbi:MAG: O-antigen ligase family protein [Rhodocyclaceae bacterium]|nr:O-antigen ligase family protein [Rhodocyclaceae bacterium]MCA3083307.1 O-antigen ligase family protein [Rhodocyclaceae bacterium]
MPKSFSAKATSRRRFVTKPFDIERWLYWSWVLLLCWLPIPLGSVEPWAFAVMQVGVYTILGVWCVAYSLGRVSPTQAFIHAKWFVWLLVGWLAYLALYLVPLPVDFIALISPATAAIHRETLAFDGGWRTVALEPHAALVSLLKSLAYVSGFVVTLLLVNSRERARQMLSVLVVFALMMAVYGILMHLNQARITWFGSPMFHGDVAKGTYFNRNHFAGYLEMTLALGIGLLIADLRDRNATTWRQFLRNFLEWIFSPKMRLRLMLCVMVIALVSTRSRMGNTAFFASLMIAGMIGIICSRYATRATVVLLVSLITIDLFIVGSWFGVEQLVQRIENTSIVRPEVSILDAQSVEERLDATTSTLAMIRDFPAVGVGPGAWSVVFPKYRAEDVMPGFFEHAHNDYAQLAAEFGVIGFVWLGVIVISSVVVAIAAHAKRRDPLMRGISFASIMGILSIMIHSSVDFNLQIPANTMYFMVLLALAWIALYLDRRPKTPEQVDPGTSDALIHQHTEVS